MAADTTSAELRCPDCAEPITLPVRVRHQGDGTALVTVDTQPAHDHIAQHDQGGA